MASKSAVFIPVSKQESAYIKGWALLCMLLHHLLTSDIVTSKLQVLFPIEPALVDMGKFCQITVGMFLFVSGIGMYYSESDIRQNAKRILSLYVKMWCLMAFLCIPLMMLTEQFRFDAVTLFKNIIGVNTSYEPNWWFVLLYAEILIVFSLMAPLLKKRKRQIDICVLTFVIVSALITEGLSYRLGGFLNYFSGIYYQLAVYFTTFLLGFFSVKYNLLDRAVGCIGCLKRWLSMFIGVFLIALSFAFSVTVPLSPLIQDWFTVPVFILGLLVIRRSWPETWLTKRMIWFGNASVWYWLLHGLLIKYLPNLLYLPRYPILVLLWMILLCTPIVFVCCWIVSLLTHKKSV